MVRTLLILLPLILISAPVFAVTDDAGKAKEKKVDPKADYSDELPRISPRGPAESLGQLVALPGFRVELVAAEPLLADPVSISFDEASRLYVVCMRGYSEQPDEFLGQIRLLEDADEDGRYDTSTVFAEKLSWPTGVICYNGGVFVAAAPDIIFFRDIDGDGVADVRKVVFTGFGRGNIQGLVNSLRWGLDNRIHGATSSSGASLTTPGKNTPPLELRRRDFAFNPRTLDLEPRSGGAQHGLSFDDWGRKFVCSNSSHIELVLFEERYMKRNRYLPAPGARKLIAVDGGQAEVYRRSRVEPWRIVRTRLRIAGTVPGHVEGGGRAAGYFTGSTGVTIYRGDAWPEEFRGQAFIGDVGSNIVHRKRLEPESIGLRAIRVDEGREFLASREVWFRPVQFANAPDGTLHVLDMYREVIEHPLSLPPPIKKHLDLTSGRDRGRIWRIVPDGFRRRPASELRLDRSDTAALLRALEHRNSWHRETAQRLLHETRDRTAIEPLEKLAATSALPQGRLHALFTLSGLDRLSPQTVLGALGDPHPRVREHAVRLSEAAARRSAEIRKRLYTMVGDVDLRVRYQLAFTLGEFDGEGRLDALAAIARHDANDRWIRLAVQSSLASGAGKVFAMLLGDEVFRDRPGGRQLLVSLAAQIGTQNHRDAIAEFLTAVETLPSGKRKLSSSLVTEVVKGLAKSGSKLQEVLGSGSGAAGKLFSDLLEEARRTATDGKASPARRAEAARTLGLGPFATARELLAKLLDSHESPEVQKAAIASLSRFDDPAVQRVVLSAWNGFSPAVRARAADLLFASTPRLAALLDAVAADEVRPADLGPVRLRMLKTHSEVSIRERAEKLLAGVTREDRLQLVERYRPSLSVRGDPARGKVVFKETCSTCHRVENVGNEIGPNLMAMKNRGTESILLNVLDPNREVNPEFLGYLVLTRDGRSLTGMIRDENATSLTLQNAEGKSETILRIDILTLKGTGLSFMPEGLEEKINPRMMADLVTYLTIVE